ncbi:hypothetical protein H257_03165 [Aphanomyces astaci]|uniref:Uncharacterized protein n=1 Tax=Aphanomyces astaci TaxID=112090 RepID=W4H1G4_APHAT|nr:hypothetical protein H257_03165 [Aphanomyces astaci]ETV85426.1 hypothetical protein H257_03165 [Aphanomyces astaci]|eukprot:XP_009825444.1 hypothetical protein H257_03165 [Aphanomyces astaci]
MDASTRVMVASAALQSRMTIPPAYHEDSLHHYKLVDSSAISKQRADRDKIIQEIEAKRASKRAASKMVHPFESALSVHGNKPRVKSSGPSQSVQKSQPALRRGNNHDDDHRVESSSTHQRRPVVKTPGERSYIQQLENEIARLKHISPPTSQQSVDEQVLQRLAEFKVAQQRDLAAVEQLVKAKKDAEAQVYQMKQQLHSSPHGPNHHNIEKAASRSHSKQHDQRSNHVAQLQHQHHRQPPNPSRGQEEPKANPMKTPAVVRPATLSSSWVPTDRIIVAADNDEDLAFDYTDGDEGAAPAFDMGPRTASSLGEPPGFDDFGDSPLKAPAKSIHDTISKPLPTSWATRATITEKSTPTATSAAARDSPLVETRKGGYFEEKERMKQNQLELEQMAKEKLARAHRAKPPMGLLTNETKLRERKQKRVENILLEEDEKLTPFKARDAPPVMDADVELVEHLRKERVAARAAELLAASKLPSRLADAAAKAKPKSPTQPRRVRIKAAPVPDFVMMQTEWKAALQRAKLSKASTRVDAFSVTDPDKLAALQKKKQERLERQKLKEDAERAAAEAKRKHAYDKAMESAKGQVQVVETEAQKLRTKAVQAKLKQRQIKEKAEEKAQLQRNAKIKQLSKQVKAEVTHLEMQRRQEKGNFVDPDEAAKAKAEENKRSFQEAIQRNKERILGAVAARPTLMERFAIDKKKEEGKRQALAAVVSNVFGKNLAAFKGVLTEGEEDLVDAMNVKSAADDDDYADDTET